MELRTVVDFAVYSVFYLLLGWNGDFLRLFTHWPGNQKPFSSVFLFVFHKYSICMPSFNTDENIKSRYIWPLLSLNLYICSSLSFMSSLTLINPALKPHYDNHLLCPEVHEFWILFLALSLPLVSSCSKVSCYQVYLLKAQLRCHQKLKCLTILCLICRALHIWLKQSYQSKPLRYPQCLKLSSHWPRHSSSKWIYVCSIPCVHF